MYSSIQELLLKAVRGEDYKAEFGQDINAYLLKTQLQVFSLTAPSKIDKRGGILDVIEF